MLGGNWVKKWVIGLLLVSLLFSIAFTKSLYVGWGEFLSIIATLSLASVLCLKNKNSKVKLLVTIAAIGFVFYLVFGIADIIIDHYLYFLPNGSEDGAPLTLGFKIEEYSDDLILGGIISMFVVLVVSFILTKIFSFGSAKTE